MKAFLSILQILLSVGLMGVILLQHRKTGGFSGMFGGGTHEVMAYIAGRQVAKKYAE